MSQEECMNGLLIVRLASGNKSKVASTNLETIYSGLGGKISCNSPLKRQSDIAFSFQ
jgi:hypothetical protein